jgi:hypothetical protein
LKIDKIEANSITVKWDPTDHSSPLLSEKTLKGYIVCMVLEFKVVLGNISKSVQVNAPIHFKVVESEHQFRDAALLLQQHKVTFFFYLMN